MSAKRVLVVDDNLDAGESMAMLLKMMGHDIRVAHDGEQAIERAGEFGPDVVLMDIGMPIMDGIEAARRIRRLELQQRPLLVAISGRGQDSDRRRSLEAGFDRHLVKPVDIDVIRALLET